MARYTGSVCRLCRREGAKLFLKGTRCYTKKCSFERRPTPPGQHGVRRRKVGEYGMQLREKQKMRRVYSVLERQFRNYFDGRPSSRPGVTGENLLRMLELRLDNVVFRAGFALSRAQARQFVAHGHFAVNGRVVDIPSYQLKVGDRVEVRKSRAPARSVQDRRREPLRPGAGMAERRRRQAHRHPSPTCPAATRCRSISTSSSWSSTTRGNPPP